MSGNRTRLVTLAIGSVILGALVGIGHALWSRSAESEIVHYSWPVKWALTFAAESPDLPAGSRFTTAEVARVEAERWTVAGQVELPGRDGVRLLTTFAADVSNRCPNVAERRCWEMSGLTLGSVPAAMRAPASTRPVDERDLPVQVASLPQAGDAVAIEPEPEPTTAAEADEDLAFILSEPLVAPADALLQDLGGWSKIRGPSAAGPHHDPVLVRDIQSGLAALGYDPGPADGVPGPRTRAAIDLFKTREGLTRTAIDFALLDEITKRLSGPHAAPIESLAPAAGRDPSEPNIADPWICAELNPKIRDCDG